MKVLLIIYFISLLFVFLGEQNEKLVKIEIGGINSKITMKKTNMYFWMLFVFFTFISSMRSGFVDTNSYRNIYNEIGMNFSNVLSDGFRIEKGFRFICYLLNHISNNSQILLMFVSIVVNYAIFKLVKNHSEDKFLSIFLYLCTVYLTTMNTLRQYFVVGIILLCFPLLLKNRKFIFLCITFLLTTIHSSAFFAGIIFVICCDKFLNKKVIILLIFTLILAFMPAFLFTSFLNLVGVNDYADMYQSINKTGVNNIRILVQLVPVMLAIYYYFKIKKNKKELTLKDSFFLNLNVINFVVFILATRNNYLARIAVYFELISIITIPYLLNRIIKKEQRIIFKVLVVFLYSIYFYFVIKGFGWESIRAIMPYFLGGN